MTTSVPTTGRTLGRLSEEQRYGVFDRQQARMPAVWEAFRRHLPDESVVVLPSISQSSGSLMQAFEERLLFLLLLLRQPRLRMIYVTSTPIAPDIVDYYLALLPGVIPSHARSRLTLMSVDDASPVPLSRKLLDRPRLLRRLAGLIPNRSRSHLIPYTTTTAERDVALALGIPMYGADPRLFDLGTKTGCRRIFADEGVPHPLGIEDLHSPSEVVDAIVLMHEKRPSLSAVIVKHNEGVSGAGNALVDLHGIPAAGDPARPDAIAERLRLMQFERPDIRLDDYTAKLIIGGGIVEERITGDELRSPSVQLRVTPAGEVELLSTHDQLLGGPSGQSYLGCVFPADTAYSRTISTQAMVIGERLAREGVIGRFAVDFVVVRDESGDWTAHAIELNLRKGGTTHPFLTLQFLTDGAYDVESGRYLTADGHEKHLIATDHLESPDLRALSRGDLFDVIAREGLHFDQSRQRGIVFHMISSLTEHGRVGLTAVGDTPAQAEEAYRRAEAALLAEAHLAAADIEVGDSEVGDGQAGDVAVDLRSPAGQTA